MIARPAGSAAKHCGLKDAEGVELSYVTDLVCVQCGKAYREGQADTCPVCGADEGILDVRFDLASAGQALTRESLASRPLSIWRYRELLPVDWPVSDALGYVGWTPLIEAPRLAKALGVGRVQLKDEGRSASGSFKDRASAIGTARAMTEGKSELALCVNRQCGDKFSVLRGKPRACL